MNRHWKEKEGRSLHAAATNCGVKWRWEKSQNVAAAAAAAIVSLRVRECWKRSQNVSLAFSPLS